jgi:hypothetical protein
MQDHGPAMTFNRVVVVASRVLGLAFAGFLTIFALDAFDEGLPLPAAIGTAAVHLIPAAIVLAMVVLAWRWPLVGAMGFLAAAALYAWIAPTGRFDWIAVISGPLALVGAGFLGTSLAMRRRATPRA